MGPPNTCKMMMIDFITSISIPEGINKNECSQKCKNMV